MILSQTTEAFSQEDQSWLGSAHGTDATRTITLDTSAFTEAVHYPNGYFPSGLPLGKITATGLYGPYAVSDEIQTLTEGGSGLTSFTITYSGQTTGSIDDDATAAEVQTALEALSNIAPGDVTVTGTSVATGLTVTFGGTLADTNVAAMTTTPTGGTGTVVVATATAGGAEASDGTQVLVGFLFCSVKAPASTTTDVVAALLDHGKVKNTKLPIAIDANGQADVAGRIQFV